MKPRRTARCVDIGVRSAGVYTQLNADNLSWQTACVRTREAVRSVDETATGITSGCDSSGGVTNAALGSCRFDITSA